MIIWCSVKHTSFPQCEEGSSYLYRLSVGDQQLLNHSSCWRRDLNGGLDEQNTQVLHHLLKCCCKKNPDLRLMLFLVRTLSVSISHTTSSSVTESPTAKADTIFQFHLLTHSWNDTGDWHVWNTDNILQSHTNTNLSPTSRLPPK